MHFLIESKHFVHQIGMLALLNEYDLETGEVTGMGNS